MFKRILVPVDGSAYSTQILPLAAALAARHRTALQLVRIVGTESEHRTAAPELERLADTVSARAACIIDDGDAVEAVLTEADREPHTLIAMTSHGRTGVLEALFGSLALRLVRARSVPVLVHRPRVPAGPAASADPIRRVVLPLDGSEMALAMAPEAARFAAWLGARLVVVSALGAEGDVPPDIHLRAADEAAGVRAQAQGLARQFGVDAGWEVLHGKPADAICEFVRSERGTVLAMATRGAGALQTAMVGSVAATCLRKAGVPILMQMR